MVQGRNYGPQVIVRRISSTSKNLVDPPVFIQVAKQVNAMKPQELRLPSRSWKASILTVNVKILIVFILKASYYFSRYFHYFTVSLLLIFSQKFGCSH